LLAVLDALARDGLESVVMTGSVFEQNEGAGETPLVAFSAYGLSKGLTPEASLAFETRREFCGFYTGSQGH
jgi:UDP-glucose 4-epimerase